MKAAQDLWNVLCSKANITKELKFIQDNFLKLGSYIINGDTIKHNSTTHIPGAVYAVARIAEELWDAVMIAPHSDFIFIQKQSDWKDLNISYEPNLERSNFVNRPPSINDRLWLHWHHLPTTGSLDGTFWHQSWFRGLCLKYSELAPTNIIVTEETKPDITHSKFPEIIYNEWVLRGSPDYCSLFEIDGTQYWWVSKLEPAPSILNLFEEQRYNIALSNNIYPVLPVGSRSPLIEGKRYFITENFHWALQNKPLNNIHKRQTQKRFNLTAYYIKMYKAVQEYFDSKGANHVRFNIYAYSAYRCLPDNLNIDLSRFNVYYVSPTANTWIREEMMEDAEQFIKWKKTGAKIIWRPNNMFIDQNKLMHPIVLDYIKITQSDGYQVSPYTPPNSLFGNTLDYYSLFRVIQNKNYNDFFKYTPQEYLEWYNNAINKNLKIGKDEDL